MHAKPFTLAVDDSVLTDLRERLLRTRWPVEPAGAGWSFGTSLDYAKRLIAYWLETYDWRRAEAAINRFNNYHAHIDGLDVHFIFEQGSGTNPQPLVLTHGWPGSIVEFLDVIEPLAHPEQFGGEIEDAFTVVVPSIPGYGFSQAPPAPITPRDVSNMWRTLMVDCLGFTSFFAQGGDLGSHVSTWLGFDHPENVTAIHLNSVYFLPLPGIENQTKEEQRWAADNQVWNLPQEGYRTQMGTHPTTLAYGLTDSPAGLAAWLIEKFHDWTVPGEVVDPPFQMDDLLTDVMFYWIGGQNPASWFYLWFYAGGGRQLPDNRRVEVPTGLLIAPRDTVLPPPDSVIARAYNVTRRTDTAHGGHFAALEQPDVFVEDVRSYFKEHRPTTDAESAAGQS